MRGRNITRDYSIINLRHNKHHLLDYISRVKDVFFIAL